jgi:hypothetical protein
MTILKWLAILGCLGYLGALAALFFAQRSFIYPIPQATRTHPQAAGFGEAEEHVLTTDDGEKIILWHVPAKPGRRVVLYFHGNGEVLAWLADRFRDITADGTGLVALSYRGYGGSGGSPSEPALLRDAAAAYDFCPRALRRKPHRRLGLFTRQRRRRGARRRPSGWRPDPGGALHFDRGCCGAGLSLSAGASFRAGQFSLR